MELDKAKEKMRKNFYNNPSQILKFCTKKYLVGNNRVFRKFAKMVTDNEIERF